jgi:hypothetical protein
MQVWKATTNAQVAEIKMDSWDLASKQRKQLATKQKACNDFGKTYLANSVTLGTRVWVEIQGCGKVFC